MPCLLQVQEHVQKELDDHVGSERPVCMSDRIRLTYLDCVIKEGMRIRPVSPVLIPHTAMTDSRYVISAPMIFHLAALVNLLVKNFLPRF